MARRLLSHKIALLAGAFTLYFPASYYLADRFLPCHIRTEQVWEWAEAPSPLLEQVLDQEFHYLGAGSQCFVFESHDKNYVLKFFKHYRFRTLSKKEKQEALIASSKLAFTTLKDHTALLHLHLNKQPLVNKKIRLKDKLGRSYSLASGQYDFVLQRKGELVIEKLNEKKLEAVLTLLKNCFDKGVGCNDFVIQKNVGYLDEKAFFIDTGAFFEDFTLKDPVVQKREALKATAKFHNWLEKTHPSLSYSFTQLLQQKFGTLTLHFF